MTPKQKKLARHALDLPNDTNRSYRSRFMATVDTPDYESWSTMVQ